MKNKTNADSAPAQAGITKTTAAELITGYVYACGPVTFGSIENHLAEQHAEPLEDYQIAEEINKLARAGTIKLYDDGQTWTAALELAGIAKENTEADQVGGHTPGPWIRNGTWISASFTSGQPMIAHTVSDSYRTPREAEANALLIASAPDLLRQRDALAEALKWIVTRLERGGKAATSDAIAQARAALALVEGGAK